MQLNFCRLYTLAWICAGCVSKHVSAYVPGGIPDAMEGQTISVNS